MDLVERYIYAVTRHLSPAQRTEVADELRATIEDMAASHTKANHKPTKQQYEAALLELGKPEKLAANYSHAKRYLIGPQWYDMYVQLIKQLLCYIPAVIVAIVLAVNLFEGDHPGAAVAESLSAGIMSIIHIFFWTTVGFVIAERSGAKPKELAAQLPAWAPSQLPAVPKKRQISTSESITGIIMLIVSAGFLISGFRTGFWSNMDTAFFNPSLWAPWGGIACGLIALAIGLELYKLKVGNWTYGVAVANTILNTIGALFVTLVFSTQDVINPAFIADLASQSGDNLQLHSATTWVSSIVIAATILGSIWGSFDGIRKAFQYNRS